MLFSSVDIFVSKLCIYNNDRVDIERLGIWCKYINIMMRLIFDNINYNVVKVEYVVWGELVFKLEVYCY